MISLEPNSFKAQDRNSGELLEPAFQSATLDDLEAAAKLAADALRPYRNLPGLRRAEFLRAIADRLDAAKDRIVPRAMAESGLPEARLVGELARTTGQVRMFARIAEDGIWTDARVDLAQPDRKPLAAPETRSMLRPLGPVAVFGASNFPLAFSVAGGDTASALAAGCPVIVKAHPAHPGTSKLVAEEILESANATGMPCGVFGILFDQGHAIGEALVRHPAIKAIGFTGSQQGGLALWRLANARPTPIPVYAEMGSINPVIVLPGKLNEAFATGLHASATAGVGQFCTNPGLVLTVGSTHDFLDSFVSKMAATPACTMLTEGIASAYEAGAGKMGRIGGVKVLHAASGPGAPSVFEVNAAAFVANSELQEEVFGPATLIVKCEDVGEAMECIRALDGQLTGSIFGDEADLAGAGDLVDELEEKVGRLIINQFPTGVEVNSSMIHGGPFPATTDSRTTSVGARAILRWARPVCYQNFPNNRLPEPLR